MSAQPKLMPDVEGLARQVDPLSRRGFFLTASAAAAAGIKPLQALTNCHILGGNKPFRSTAPNSGPP